jgi:hypothetical protein
LIDRQALSIKNTNRRATNFAETTLASLQRRKNEKREWLDKEGVFVADGDWRAYKTGKSRRKILDVNKPVP